MRNVRLRFFAGGVGAVVVAIVACGGSSQNPAGGSEDAGADTNVADTNVPDTNDAANSPDTSDSAPACADASLTNLDLADAALGDSGSSTGTCIACVNASCATDVATCQADCTCLNSLVCVYQNCASDFGSEISLGECALVASCISTSGLSASNPLLTLAGCIQSSCGPQCGVPATPDAGTPDAEGDAPSDAPTDG